MQLDLIRRYNQPGPRYTSYPTAPHFTEDYGPADFTKDLDASGADTPLSLYLHLPFCRSLCYYCGCHMKVTRDRDAIQEYLEALKREIDLITEHVDLSRPVVQMHWGGGTPTYLTAEQIRDLGAHLHDRFRFTSDAEISLEADPRTLTEDRIAAAADVGFNRISIGVQDVNREVQEAINRVQPVPLVAQAVALVAQAVDWARTYDFSGVNVDLVYGLPHQTRERFAETIDVTRRLAPNRVAVYSYAHVPSLKKHQRVIDEDALPEPEEKLRLFKLGIERLTGPGGYRFIGMDHFAKPDDPLAQAQEEGTLHRNFQGYSTRAGAEVVAFGVSGISQLEGAYAQNVKGFPAYYERIDEELLGTYRGYCLSDDDQRRQRSRICDLGYLREPYVDAKGRLLGRCPAEPGDDYVRKGGDPKETEGRACLCNALMANIGLPQYRNGTPELPLYTGGDALLNLPLGSVADPQYDADDVLDYLYGDTPALAHALESALSDNQVEAHT